VHTVQTIIGERVYPRGALSCRATLLECAQQQTLLPCECWQRSTSNAHPITSPRDIHTVLIRNPEEALVDKGAWSGLGKRLGDASREPLASGWWLDGRISHSSRIIILSSSSLPHKLPAYLQDAIQLVHRQCIHSHRSRGCHFTVHTTASRPCHPRHSNRPRPLRDQDTSSASTNLPLRCALHLIPHFLS
jgi:hypothetical protein